MISLGSLGAYGSSAQWQLALDTLQQLCLEDLELFGLQRYSGKAREMLLSHGLRGTCWKL